MNCISDKCNVCKNLLNNKVEQNTYTYKFENELCKYEVGLANPNFNIKLDLLCDYYMINENIYINKCCYNSIIYHLQHIRAFNEIFITSTADFSNYIRIKLLNEYNFDIANRYCQSSYFEINYLGKKNILSDNKTDEITIKLEEEKETYKILIDKLENENKNYKKEIQYLKSINPKSPKYDYKSIKEKNKKLNNEFKRVAKLMKLK